jgi:hypothetical protein
MTIENLSSDELADIQERVNDPVRISWQDLRLRIMAS